METLCQIRKATKFDEFFTIDSINQSINQSIEQKAPSHSINQSIHNFPLIFIDSTNQAIKQSTYQSRDILGIPDQSINQSTDYGFKSVFSLNCRGLQVLIIFCTVLGDEKSNETVRWGKGWTEPGDCVLALGYVPTVSSMLLRSPSALSLYNCPCWYRY